MQVEFKLTTKQSIIAARISEEVRKNNKFQEENHKGSLSQLPPYGGNLVGYLPKNVSKVYRQCLDFWPMRKIVTYVGNRNDIILDNGSSAILAICGGHVEMLKVTEYKTSNPELKWYECIPSKSAPGQDPIVSSLTPADGAEFIESEILRMQPRVTEVRLWNMNRMVHASRISTIGTIENACKEAMYIKVPKAQSGDNKYQYITDASTVRVQGALYKRILTLFEIAEKEGFGI